MGRPGALGVAGTARLVKQVDPFRPARHGASDGVPGTGYPTWEEWTEDVLAVLDAAGSERAAICTHADALCRDDRADRY